MSKKYKIPEKEIPVLNEPAAMYSYVSQTPVSRQYINLLGQISTIKDEIISKWLNITTRTLRNYKTKDVKLKPNTQEHVISLLSLYQHGESVFNSKDKFESWLLTKNILLDSKAPSDFLDTITGIQFIDNRLTAMEYGENA